MLGLRPLPHYCTVSRVAGLTEAPAKCSDVHAVSPAACSRRSVTVSEMGNTNIGSSRELCSKLVETLFTGLGRLTGP